MILIIGVRFRKSGKVYYFDPAGLSIDKGNHVIVETARGVEYGTVVLSPRNIDDEKVIQPLKPVIRLATKEDDDINAENISKEKEAFDICLEKIKKHELRMKLIDSEYTFDRNKLLFYFTADGRIDFRDLVKDLAAIFRTRIELRQIGVRDETKLMGGIGICGRPLCCHIYLADFAPVSIKMAKEQNLSLNPAKISGVCGRLMCCLKNEEEAYEYLNSTLPHINDTVKTIDGYEGIVHSISVLKQKAKILITKDNEKELREYHASELTFEKRNNNSDANTVAMPLPDEELDENALKELEEMEQNDLEELTGTQIQEEEQHMPVRQPKKYPKKPYKQNHNNTNHKKNYNTNHKEYYGNNKPYKSTQDTNNYNNKKNNRHNNKTYNNN
ncbi:MAG: stage 0 sporulation family protein [Lachnospiraceae bacterium]|nr:stage 0 sporulation family protein [Lachnospiraceae bacterium]